MRSGSQVLAQSTILREVSPTAGRMWFSTTSSTCDVSNTASTIGSQARATSAIDAAARPPMSASRTPLAASMS
jgi:hypothetical protein